MAVKASVDTSNQTTVRVGQQNATQVTSTQTGITYAATAGTAFNVVGGIASVTQLSFSGISTLGVVTAIRYYGDGSNLTGTGNTTDVSTNSLVVLGISTLGITSATDLEAQQLIVTGISTLGITSATDLEAQQLSVSGISTFNDDVFFKGATRNIKWNSSQNDLEIGEDARLKFNNELDIWHGGTHGFIKNYGGDLRIRGDKILLKRENDEEKYLVAQVQDGRREVLLYYNNDLKFGTTGIGVTVYGNTETQTLNVTGVATVSGTGGLNITNALDVEGDVDLGASASNTITVSGKIDSDLVPSGTTRDLGSITDEWRNIFISDNINANGNIVGDTATNISGINSVTATSFYGDGSGLDNTGATLSAASGTQRLVLTSLTSGTMVSAATDGDLTFQSSSNLLSAGKLLVVGISTFTGDITANGNIVGDNATNITGIAGVTASTLTGTLQTAAQPNVTSVGTLTSLDVTGNVSIGGTLTYDDVTNVDSIGLITARQGIHVLAGAGVSIAAGGLNVSSGISTFVNNVNFKDTLFTDKIKRYSDSGTTTKIILNDENINLFAGDHTNETLSVTPFQVTIANSGHLNVTGVSTFAGITTVTGDTLFTKQLSVSGLSTYIGVATYKSDVFIDGTLTAGAIDGGTY